MYAIQDAGWWVLYRKLSLSCILLHCHHAGRILSVEGRMTLIDFPCSCLDSGKQQCPCAPVEYGPDADSES
ncbi:MAG: hypothetical protein BYD32DRAFT_404485 [Podila humilis]|nr:MAG: hypothetical protein BYD32DRAFT_404485 [Podila humilis]